MLAARENSVPELTRLCYPKGQPQHPCNLARHIESICSKPDVNPKEQQECYCGEYFRATHGCIECKHQNGLFTDDNASDMHKWVGDVSSIVCDGPAPTVHIMQVVKSVGQSFDDLPGLINSEEAEPKPTPVPVSDYFTADGDAKQITPPGTIYGQFGEDRVFTPGPYIAVPTSSGGSPSVSAPKETGKEDSDDSDEIGKVEKGSAASQRVNTWTALAMVNVVVFMLMH